MKLHFYLAEISFCTDMTDINSPVIPVGALFLAESLDGEEASQAVLLIAPPVPPEGTDEFTQSWLKDYPELIQAQLEWILNMHPGKPIGDILEMLQESMQNSFFISDINSGECEPKTSEVAFQEAVRAIAVRRAAPNIARIGASANITLRQLQGSNPTQKSA